MEKRYYVKRVPPGTYSYDKDVPLNAPSIIVNNYISTLNDVDSAKVPHTIVILWNDYRFWNNSDLLQHQMKRILHKFVKEIKKITEIRNFDLPEKAANWSFPIIFISQPLPLPNNMTTRYPDSYKSNRRRFTRLLQKGEAKDGYITINFDEFTCENKNKFFNKNGTIAPEGYDYIWLAVSEAIQSNDECQEKLIRRAKAKQLAALEPDKQSPKQDQDINIDGIWPGQQSPIDKPTKNSPARRSLQSEFNQVDPMAGKRQSLPPSQTHSKKQFKCKRGRGRGFFGPPQGFFPYNPFYQGFHYQSFNRNKRGRFGPY